MVRTLLCHRRVWADRSNDATDRNLPTKKGGAQSSAFFYGIDTSNYNAAKALLNVSLGRIALLTSERSGW